MFPSLGIHRRSSIYRQRAISPSSPVAVGAERLKPVRLGQLGTAGHDRADAVDDELLGRPTAAFAAAQLARSRTTARSRRHGRPLARRCCSQ